MCAFFERKYCMQTFNVVVIPYKSISWSYFHKILFFCNSVIFFLTNRTRCFVLFFFLVLVFLFCCCFFWICCCCSCCFTFYFRAFFPIDFIYTCIEWLKCIMALFCCIKQIMSYYVVLKEYTRKSKNIRICWQSEKLSIRFYITKILLISQWCHFHVLKNY